MRTRDGVASRLWALGEHQGRRVIAKNTDSFRPNFKPCLLPARLLLLLWLLTYMLENTEDKMRASWALGL